MYKIAKILRKILSICPLAVIKALGVCIGTVLYWIKSRRSMAWKNISLAFPDKSAKQIAVIAKRSFISFGRSMMESLVASRLVDKVTFVGIEDIDEHGGIMVAIHSGSWELYNIALARQLKGKYAMMVRQQKKKGFETVLQEVRDQQHLNVCSSVRGLIHFIKSNYSVGLVVDHGAESNALYCNFFSQLVPIPKGAVFLARKYQKPLYPCFGYRTGKNNHVVVIGKKIRVTEQSDEQVLQLLNNCYQQYLRQHPNDYLWYFKRFKRKKTLDILMLSDGKPGHYKQSLALVSFIKEKDKIVREKTVVVEYKSAFARIVADICAWLVPRHCLGAERLLRWLLIPSVATTLQYLYADIVVSTGTTVSAANRLTASMLGARSVIILRSNVALRKFDRVFVPEHDRVFGNNVIAITGALCYPADSTKKVQQCREVFTLTERKKIAVVIGGSLTSLVDFEKNCRVFFKSLKAFCQQYGYGLLCSTSRRTPPAVETLIQQQLQGFPYTEMLVIARRQNYDFAFDAMVSLADQVFISGDSISMVSEVLSHQKPCGCVLLEEYDAKHQLFFQSVKNDVTLLEPPYQLHQRQAAPSQLLQRNRQRVLEGMRKLI